jgi:hypothetical protein
LAFGCKPFGKKTCRGSGINMYKTYRIYNHHKKNSVSWLFEASNDLDASRYALAHAESAGRLGYDGLYRVFESDEGFKVAYSVLGGKVKAHYDVTIPEEHW